VIKSFQRKKTKTIFDSTVSRKFQQNIQQRARRNLRMLNNAKTLDDLKIPLSNHVEKLIGDRVVQHSIKINDQWRICFVW
jgi:proteic killer suppression protein